MNQNTPSLKLQDLNTVMGGVEHVAVIALAAVLVWLMFKQVKKIDKTAKQVVAALVFSWALAYGAQYIVEVKNYIDYTRPYYVEASKQKTGL